MFGLAQALALIPGVSRSGGTITAGLFMGFERAAAARYAFLLAIPAVFGSGQPIECRTSPGWNFSGLTCHSSFTPSPYFWWSECWLRR